MISYTLPLHLPSSKSLLDHPPPRSLLTHVSVPMKHRVIREDSVRRPGQGLKRGEELEAVLRKTLLRRQRANHGRKETADSRNTDNVSIAITDHHSQTNLEITTDDPATMAGPAKEILATTNPLGPEIPSIPPGRTCQSQIALGRPLLAVIITLTGHGISRPLHEEQPIAPLPCRARPGTLLPLIVQAAKTAG